MDLQEQIYQDLKAAMKAKNEVRISALRVILGEFQRQPKKQLNDEEVKAVIRKLVKAEKEMLSNADSQESEYLLILERYLPDQPSEEEIRNWIQANIDFSVYQNKMQAMKPIMAHYGGTVDGNLVRRILDSV